MMAQYRFFPLACALALSAPFAAVAAQQCLANSIDQVGRCAAFRGTGVPALVDRELRGVVASPQVQPPFAPDLAATRIMGHIAQGQAWPIQRMPAAHSASSTKTGKGSDWVLVTYPARLDKDGQLQRGHDESPQALFWLRWTPGPTAEAAPTPRATLQVVAQWRNVDAVLSDAAAEPNAQAVPCVDPSGDAGDAPQQLGPPFGWFALGKKWLLTATASRSEGYAGGGGDFASRVLLDVRAGQLLPVACHSVRNYQMFGGDWNEDGTRQHPEALSQWRLVVQRGGARHHKQGAGALEWPDLLVQPLTRKTPAARLVWSPEQGHYVPASVRRQKNQEAGQ